MRPHGSVPALASQVLAVACLAAWLAPPAGLAAQLEPAGRNIDGEHLVMDSLPRSAGQFMETVLEKMWIDGARVEIRWADEAVTRAVAPFRGRDHSRAIEDSVASAVLAAEDVWIRLRFEFGFGWFFGLRKFLSESRDSVANARDHGLIDDEAYRRITGELPERFAFLEDRDLEEGDHMYYRVRGDTVRVQYVDLAGVTRLDVVDVGEERRLALLGSYLAPGSGFRRGLVRSFLEHEGR